MQTKDIDYTKEALKARNRALTTLIIGLVLIPITAALVFAGFGSAFGDLDAIPTVIAFMVIAGIVALVSIILLFVAFGFFVMYMGFKRRIKNPLLREADKPKYPGF